MQYDKLNEWLEEAESKRMYYILVMQDQDDKQFFPVYFQFYTDSLRYQENIISESKLKVIELIKISQLKEAK